MHTTMHGEVSRSLLRTEIRAYCQKRAIIAIAILTAIYSIFCIDEVWNPVDLFKIDMPKHLTEKQLAKAIKQATRFFEKQGLSVA